MAITVTVTATKVDIVSTGGIEETWDAIVLAVNAVLPGKITGLGTAASPYHITCPSGYCEVEFSSSVNVKVRFVADTYVEWANCTVSTYIWDHGADAQVYIEEGCHFNMSAGASRLGYFILYGSYTYAGTALKPIVFENYRSMYDYALRPSTANYVELKNCGYSTGYLYYNAYAGLYLIQGATHSWTNIKVYNDNGSYNGRIYIAHSSGGVVGGEHVIYENWEIDHLNTIYSFAATVKLKNFAYSNFVSYLQLSGAGFGFQDPYSTISASPGFHVDVHLRNQPKFTFENCEFDNMDSGNYGIYLAYNSIIKFKDCTFKNQLTGIRTGWSPTIILVGTTTFINVTTTLYYSVETSFLHAKEIPITVKDSGGNPIEGAVVRVIEKDNREEWSLVTDTNGEIKDVHGDDVIIVEKEEISIGVFTDWNNHDIIISKDGYIIHTEEFNVRVDTAIEVELELLPTPYPPDPPKDITIMPADRDLLKAGLKDLFTKMAEVDDPEKKTEDTLEELAEGFTETIDAYYKTGSSVVTPDAILEAGLSNQAGPVLASNNLIGDIE